MLLEPFGEDLWLSPGERLTVVDDQSAEDALPFEVIALPDGIGVGVSRPNEAQVVAQAGAVVECGYQRPPDWPHPRLA
jgi:hypothetical protein